jgi:enoyl-[acyl-carrier protein] reductase II
MFKTPLCDLFGIEYPIILGGMLWVGKANLTAAVSEAGGLGIMGAGGMRIDEIESEIAIIKEKTRKPFGVNIPLVRPDSEEMIDAAITNGASVIATSAGSPQKFTRMIQDRGCRVIHVVANVKFAQKSAEAGVDAVAAEGYEAGGHNGHDEITTMALLPQVSSTVQIPVIAAGGIADGRGLVAAFALGAQGVQMGTRFLATYESGAHEKYKDAVIRMADDDTCVTGRTTIGPTRAIKNKLTAMIVNAEKGGATPEDLFELIGEGRSIKACIEGDCEEGSMYCGQIGGHIKTLKSAKQVIEDVIAEAKAVITSLQEHI